MASPRDPFSRFAHDRRGGVAVMGAIMAMLFVVLAALAIDLGSVALKAREVQGTADLAALSGARNIPKATEAAQATARANLGNKITIQTQTGVYVGDRAVAVKDRFTSGGANPNAVRVTISDEAPLFFAGIMGFDKAPVTRSAIAALPGSQRSAVFSIGTRLLSLQNGIVNALLGGLLGSEVNLSVMDYNKLVGADINLLQFLDALSVDLGLEVGDYNALLAHEVDTGDVLKVLEVLLGSDERTILSQLTGTGLDAKLKVGDLIGTDVNARDGLRRALNLDVSALDLIMASLKTANGHRQLALDSEINALVADVTLRVAIGERPNEASWITVSGENGPTIRTAQTRIYAKVKTKSAFEEVLGLDLQVFAEVASAEAKIKNIKCLASRGVDVQARPGLIQVAVGRVENPESLDNFKTTIRTSKLTLSSILGIPTVRIYANVQSKDRTWQDLTFAESEIGQHTVKTVKAKEIVSSLLSNLTKSLDLDVIGLPIGWLLGSILDPVGIILGWILDMILNPLLDLLGIGLGEADVRVLSMTCPGDVGGIPALVG